MTITPPHILLFGYWGFAPFPWLLILSRDHKHNQALIAHERYHQSQQRRDGWLTFWWRYLTNKRWRLAYEVDAYREWLAASPQDHFKVLWWLEHNYNTGLSRAQLLALLADTN